MAPPRHGYLVLGASACVSHDNVHSFTNALLDVDITERLYVLRADVLRCSEELAQTHAHTQSERTATTTPTQVLSDTDAPAETPSLAFAQYLCMYVRPQVNALATAVRRIRAKRINEQKLSELRKDKLAQFAGAAANRQKEGATGTRRLGGVAY